MKNTYYQKAKMTQIIMDLIYLHQEMKLDGHTDNKTLAKLNEIINLLKYYLQFIK